MLNEPCKMGGTLANDIKKLRKLITFWFIFSSDDYSLLSRKSYNIKGFCYTLNKHATEKEKRERKKMRKFITYFSFFSLSLLTITLLCFGNIQIYKIFCSTLNKLATEEKQIHCIFKSFSLSLTSFRQSLFCFV